MGSAWWRIQDVVPIMSNPETHPSNFLQEYYLKYFCGWPVSRETEGESCCSKTYTEISLEKSLCRYFQVLFPLEGREGVMLLMQSYLYEW